MVRGALPLLLLLTATTAAQQVVAPSTVSHGAIVATKDGLTLPAGEFTVAELVEAVAVYLCRNYLYDPDVVANTKGFTLQRPISLDAIGGEEMLYSLLAARHLAAVPIDELRGVYQVIALGSDQQRPGPIAATPWRTPEEILRRPRLRELVMTAVDLQHADAVQLSQVLRMHFSLQGSWRPGVTTACASARHTLLLHGYRDQLAQLILLVRQLDRLTGPEVRAPDPALQPMQQRLDAIEHELAELRALVKAPAKAR